MRVVVNTGVPVCMCVCVIKSGCAGEQVSARVGGCASAARVACMSGRAACEGSTEGRGVRQCGWFLVVFVVFEAALPTSRTT